MSLRLHCSFLGVPLHGSSNGQKAATFIYLDRGRHRGKRRRHKCLCTKQNHWITQMIRFSHICGQNVELLKKNLGSRYGMRAIGVGERISRTQDLVSTLAPLWKEGLFIFRCSVFISVLSGVCLLVWYGQSRARGLVEARILPSVCSTLSEYLQREIDIGKVRRVSPLSITLESCSIGTHGDEFSCGEVPNMKIRIRPFASISRGKIVVDAVLSHPSVLVAQKRDYSWLGIPSYTDSDVPQRHSSTEEGIGYRTKTRRIAREEAGARWEKERDEAAKNAAEMGYIVTDDGSRPFMDDGLEEVNSHLAEFRSSDSFLCAVEKMQLRDHHCMDTGVDYNMKHADLEKSFGVKVPGSGLKFWSRIIQGPKKHKNENNGNGNKISAASSTAAKRRILDRSGIAAALYFQRLSLEKSKRLLESSNDFKHNLETLLVKNETGSMARANLDSFTKNVVLRGDDIIIGKTDDEILKSQEDHTLDNSTPLFPSDQPISSWMLKVKSILPQFSRNAREVLSRYLSGPIQKLTSHTGLEVDDIVAELDTGQSEGSGKMLPVMIDSVSFKDGKLMLLAYGDNEPREMENVNGHVMFQNHYGRVYVQLSGNCKMWRSGMTSEDGGWLSTDVFVDVVEQKWHANLKTANLFAPLFESILDIPVKWSKGRATGEVHLCMSVGETFPNLHGQLDVSGLAFHIFDAPSGFSDTSASLCFRGQQIFLHNARGNFGAVPLEASGDFGINPDEGEFHIMCQVPSVEVNALMKTFKMKPLLFPLAGSVTTVFNCQGPLDAPVFVGSGMVSRKMSHIAADFPPSSATEAVLKSKEAGAVAAFDRVPFSYLSANFTFSSDSCVADLYGIRATLVDGGEIRGAGNAWICPEGEEDETAMDVNFSGSLGFDKIMDRYVPGYLQLVPYKLGVLSGDTKLSGSLLRPKFDIKWTAPEAEGSFSDGRGDIIISRDSIVVNSSSVAFDLNTKVQTSYYDDFWHDRKDFLAKSSMPFIVEGVEFDLRMRGFEFFSLVPSYPFDSPKPINMKSTGRIKFQGKVLKPCSVLNDQDLGEKNKQEAKIIDQGNRLEGDVQVSGLKLNQLILGPQLAGLLSISHNGFKLDATGRPDESLAVEFIGPLNPNIENSHVEKLLSLSLQKGQLKANICFQPSHSANLEVRNLPLDELELGSLRGTIQRAEIQLNLQKRRGHGQLSVLRPKFSGVLGEALDVAARWSGDVITLEKTVLEQSNSRYELHGEYVLPGTRDRNLVGSRVSGGLLKTAMAGNLGSAISSMGRWRMRFEVPRAEVAEMLPLARLISRSADPAVHTRSKDIFIQSLQSVGLDTEILGELLKVIHGHSVASNEVILEELTLPGLGELKGRWNGSLEASGGGNGDTMADFDLHGEDWEWGAYKTQRVLAVGAYSNDAGLHLEQMFIQKDNATIHADGTLLGPKSNLHFAVLNFPVSLVPTLVQVVESSTNDVVQSLRRFVAPIKGILHMEGDLRGTLAKPECDVQVRLLDGAIGGIDLGKAEIVASLTAASRFLFNANFEPIVQNGHVHIQGSIPVNFVQNSSLEEDNQKDKSRATWDRSWVKERERGSGEDVIEKKLSRERNEEGWDTQLAESLKVLNWNILDVGEVRVDADIKDGGMMLLTALSPHANWLHGNADIMMQVRGTVEQPVLDGFASFYRASISSPVLWKPLTNFGGTVHIKSNRLCISSLESRVSRRGKLFVKGNLPLRTSEATLGDQIDLKCEVLEVRAKNILSAQVDSQVQITGSILQPNITGNIKLSQGEAYLPHDKGSGVAVNRLTSNQRMLPGGSVNRDVALRYVSRFFSSRSAASGTQFLQPSVESSNVEKEMELVDFKPSKDIRLSDLKLILGPELRIVYPLILNFGVNGELELNGLAHPKLIQPKGVLSFENGDVNLVATQVRLKQEHLNIAKFEPENGLDPMLDLVLVGSEWQFRIQSRASSWQDKLVVTSTRSVEQDALSPLEAARVFESQLAESILEGNGQLAFQKLATTTLEKLMPRLEGKGEFGQARWRLVYAPQIPSLLSSNGADPLKSLASSISFGTEVEVQLGKRLQASIVRQMKDSEMAMQWTLMYQLTSRLRVLLQSAPSKRLLFEYSASSQD